MGWGVAWWYQPARIVGGRWTVLLVRTWGGIFTSEPIMKAGQVPERFDSYAEAFNRAQELNEKNS